MINIEVFSSPGCCKCAEAKTLLEKTVAQTGRNDFVWRDVSILDEIDYAVELGIMNTPAIAIDGTLVFTSLPSAAALLAELEKRT